MLSIALGLALLGASAAPVPSSDPRLVLVIVVDQLRLEEVQRLAPLLGPDGFGGLESRGVLLDGRYLTVNTETGPGHATISTGAYGNEHGVVANTMMFPEGKRYVVQDPDAPIWGVSDVTRGRSPRVLRVPAVGDQLKLNTGGKARVVSVTGKDRSAVLTAGFAADMALWWDSDLARFVSSTFYAPSEPAWVRAFNEAHPPSEIAQFTWEPQRPVAELADFARADDAPGEGVRFGVGATFPKALSTVPQEKIGHSVRVTPKMDALTLQAAAAAVREYRLCDDGITDLMFVGMSGYDMIGHAYGPYSVERLDSYVRLSADVAAFVASVEKVCPRDKLAIIVTSDHGMTPLPEDSTSLRIPAGRMRMSSVMQAVDASLDEVSGQNEWVALFSPPHIWLRSPKTGTVTCDAMENAARAAAKVPGVGRTVATCRLESMSNPVWTPFHHVVDFERTGHILVEPKPFWIWDDGSGDVGGGDHGTSFVSDQRVPVIVVTSPRFRVPQQYQDAPIDMRQVAPTIAVLGNHTPPSAARQAPLVVRERKRAK